MLVGVATAASDVYAHAELDFNIDVGEVTVLAAGSAFLPARFACLIFRSAGLAGVAGLADWPARLAGALFDCS